MDDADTGYFHYEPLFVTESTQTLWRQYLESQEIASDHAVLPNGLTIGEAAVLYCRHVLFGDGGQQQQHTLVSAVYDSLPKRVAKHELRLALNMVTYVAGNNKIPHKRSLCASLRRICECNGIPVDNVASIATKVIGKLQK